MRYEHVRSEATGGIVGVDTNTGCRASARPSTSRATAARFSTPSYGHYAGKSTQNYFNKNTVVGNAGRVTRTYIGPAGQGLDFAPAFDPANYTITSGSFPTANVFFDDDLCRRR